MSVRLSSLLPFAFATCAVPARQARAQDRQLIAVETGPAPSVLEREFEGEEWGCARFQSAEADHWWSSQGDRFLARPAWVLPLGAGTVAAAQVALTSALARESDPEALECLLLALACAAPRDPDVFAQLVTRTRASDPRLRATAALALGWTRRRDAVPTLLQLLADSDQEARTRAFAGYGLALALEGALGSETEHDVLRAARAILEAPNPDIDIETAAVHMLRALRTEASTAGGAALRDMALQVLWSYHDRDDRARLVARAHVAAAVASLLRRGGDVAAAGRLRLARAISRADDRHEWLLGVGAVQALGTLCEGQPCPAVEGALQTYAERGRNWQARGLARLSLGRIGSDAAIGFLLGDLRAQGEARDEMDLGWTALALGVTAHQARSERRQPAADAIGAALLDAVQRSPRSRGERLLISLGLSGYQPAGPWLCDLVRQRGGVDQILEMAATGLALLGEPQALAVLPRPSGLVRRPFVFQGVVHARACLGDSSVVGELKAHAAAGRNVALRSAAMRLLAEVGGDDGVRALLAMLSDPEPLSRALAASGLAIALVGGSPLAELRRDVNYRLAPPSLSNMTDGVLDLW